MKTSERMSTTKNMGLCDRYEERIYTKEKKGVSVVKRGEIHKFINE